MKSTDITSIQKPMVLLVDDRADNLFTFKGALKKIECDTAIVSSGTDALDKLEKQEFGLIILDAQMPGMDGFATLQRIKANPHTQHIPVILISDSDMGGQSTILGYELGAVDVLIRPFNDNVLRAKVSTFVSLHRTYKNLLQNTQHLNLEEKNIIQNLQQDRVNFLQFFKETPALVIMTQGPDHTLTMINDSYAKFFGIDSQGKTLREAQPESLELHEICDQIFKSGKAFNLNEASVTWVDQVRFFKLTGTALFSPQGEINGTLIYAQEVSAEVLARQQNENQEQALQLDLKNLQMENELERQKQAQIYQRLSQEIPEILQRLQVAKEETSRSQESRSTLTLQEAIEEKKETSITHDTAVYEPINISVSLIDPQSIVQEVAALLKGKTQAKSLQMNITCDKATAGLIKSDASNIRQILLNIVNNAIDFTHHGSIKVHTFPIIAEGKEFTAFEVTDTGRGILPTHQESIFQPPANGLKNSSLFFSRRMAQALGGDVHLMNSYLNQGSTFLITVANKIEGSSTLTVASKKVPSDHHRPLIPEL